MIWYFDHLRFGTTVAVKREMLGLSRREVCELAGLQQNTLATVETGEAGEAPRLTTVLAICTALEIDPRPFLKTRERKSAEDYRG